MPIVLHVVDFIQARSLVVDRLLFEGFIVLLSVVKILVCCLKVLWRFYFISTIECTCKWQLQMSLAFC